MNPSAQEGDHAVYEVTQRCRAGLVSTGAQLDYGKIEFDKSLDESERASIDSYVEESKILEMDLAT